MKDEKNWVAERQTNDIPGLNAAVGVGMAVGSPDKKKYWVEFQYFKIEK